MTNDIKKILIRLLIYLFLGLLLFVIIIEGSKGLIPYGLFIVGGITFVFAAMARLLSGTWKYKRLLSISKVFLFTGLINMILFFVIVRIQGKITKNNADMIIQKIETYKKDNGHYPYSLESLKPKYIDRLPKAWIGILPNDFIYDYSEQVDHRFMYFKPVNQTGDYQFWIGYYGYIGVEYFYNSKEKEWHIDD
jgi:hypothetical protein